MVLPAALVSCLPLFCERMEFAKCPKCFEGFPIALVAASLISLAFMGFSGLKVW